MVFIPETETLTSARKITSLLKTPAFFIDRFEVTQSEYQETMSENPSFFVGSNRPVEKITWFDAEAYCRKRNKRLPTEWEWESAARGGSVTRFFWGEGWNPEFGWSKENADKQTHPVGMKKPNRYGLYDTSGNVWEWTGSDHENGGKVLRGGSWRNGSDSLRSSNRISSLPNRWFHYVGFRCAMDLKY